MIAVAVAIVVASVVLGVAWITTVSLRFVKETLEYANELEEKTQPLLNAGTSGDPDELEALSPQQRELEYRLRVARDGLRKDAREEMIGFPTLARQKLKRADRLDEAIAMLEDGASVAVVEAWLMESE